MAALANLKQTNSVSEYHKAFIRLAHLVKDSGKNLINQFLEELREYLRGKVKLDKPLTMVASYRSACAREMIAMTEKN